MDDLVDHLLIKPVLFKNFTSSFRALFCMTDTPVCPVLTPPANIMKKGCECDNCQIRPLFFPDPQGKPVDSVGMIPVMGFPGILEEQPGLSFYLFYYTFTHFFTGPHRQCFSFPPG
jgi:hypothetical protein